MSTLGVYVGRFQTDTLHEGHLSVLYYMKHNVDRVLIVIGEGPLPTTTNNPLSAAVRRQMLLDTLDVEEIEGEVVILKDHPDDDVWSKNLDELILSNYYLDEEVALYHSRDTTTSYYTGQYPMKELPEVLGLSSTLRRYYIGKREGVNEDAAFRRGVIWANQNRFPTVYSCVDAAVTFELFDGINTGTYVLVITKDIAPGYMWPGGFAELNSTDEDDARREVAEETGLDTSFFHAEYLGSFTQDDWRYRSEVDEIRTRLFAIHMAGRKLPEVAGADDAATAQWVNIKDLKVEDFNKCHRALFERLLEEL